MKERTERYKLENDINMPTSVISEEGEQTEKGNIYGRINYLLQNFRC